MIAQLTGTFIQKTPAQVVMDVHGVGYEVHISLHTWSHIQSLDRGTLFTHLQIKEDAHVLWGFAEPIEKQMFVQLIGITGVGAATARMMLSSLKPQELAAAIAAGNTRQLESIKGIGKKTAERIVLELKEKIRKSTGDQPASSILKDNTLELDALNALIALGIARNAAEQAVRKAMQAQPESNQLEPIIKKALQFI